LGWLSQMALFVQMDGLSSIKLYCLGQELHNKMNAHLTLMNLKIILSKINLQAD